MTFEEVDLRYLELKQASLAGSLTDEQFDEALRELMVHDEEGRWWAKSRERGEWHYYDAAGSTWVRAEPGQPGVAPSAAPVTRAEPAEPAEPTGAMPPMSPAETEYVPPVTAATIAPADSQLPRWAARAPASAVPPPQPVAPAGEEPVVRPRRADTGNFGPLPELGSGMRLLFYLLSFLVPLAGIVLFFIYRNKPAREDRAAARAFLIIGVAMLALYCIYMVTIWIMNASLLT
jgi:hypothetical protein